MARNAHKTQKRRSDGKWARQRKQAQMNVRHAVPGEMSASSTGQSGADAFRYAAEMRNEIHAHKAAEDKQATEFVQKYYEDLPGMWARNPEEMEWQTTCMFSAKQTSVAEMISDGHKIKTPRSEPPSMLNLEISRMISGLSREKRTDKIKSLVAAC